MSEPVRRVALGAISGAGAVLAATIAGIIQLRLTVSYLPGSLAGTWILLLTLAGYLALLDFGFGTTLSREIAFASAMPVEAQKRARIAALINTAKQFFLVVALGLVASGVIAAVVGSSFIAPELRTAMLFFSLGAGVVLYGNTALVALFGLAYVGAERLVRAGAQILWVVLSYLFLKAGAGVVGLSVAWLLQGLCARIAAYALLVRFVPWIRTEKGKARWDLFRFMLRPSLATATVSLGALLIIQSGTMVVAATIGLVSVPAFDALVKVSSAILTFSLLVVTASTPYVSRSVSRNDLGTTIMLITLNARIALGISMSAAIFFAAFGDQIIALWLGPSQFAGYYAMWIMLFFAVLEVHHVVLATAVVAAGKVPFVFMALFSGFLTVALGVWLTPSYGLAGMAASMVVAQVLSNSWYVPMYAFRYFKIRPMMYARAVLPRVVVFFGVLSVGAIAARLCQAQYGLAVSIAFYVSVTLVAGLVIIPTAEDRVWLRKFKGGSYAG